MTAAAAGVRFVIVAARRTGSNLLCTLLGSHPEVLCHHELFNPTGLYYALPLRESGFSLGTQQERDADPVGFLARVWAQPLGRRCVGFKVTRGQDPRMLDALLSDPGVHVIVLHRANRIKTYVSELRAEQTRRWEVYDRADIVEIPRVRVDPRALEASIAQNDEFYAEVDAALGRSGSPVLRVGYERLLSPVVHQDLLAFLGLPGEGARLSPGSVKVSSTDLSELIDNFDELGEQLAGKGFDAELTDCGL